MNFNLHSNLLGRHAFLSPSGYHWVNYTDEKLDARYALARAAARGVALHEFAHRAINLRIRVMDDFMTLTEYVNDGITYNMSVEQALYYSENCFGHADTIAFEDMKLRIHDLKTGITRASMKQLEVYAAIFCLEYGFSPFAIEIELRIYQEEVVIHIPDPDVISHIMDRIISFDRRIELLKGGVIR